MPPRIPISLPLRARCVQPRTSFRPTLPSATLTVRTTTSPTPSLSLSLPSTRHASILASLSNVRSSYHKRIRRGRGPASGKGKTAGRGHKGQKQHGKVPAGFEGGQTPLHIVHGTHGAKNVFAQDFATVPLSRIRSWVAQGRIDGTQPITPRELLKSRCVHAVADGIKLLASSRGHENSVDDLGKDARGLHIVVSRASKAAIEEVEREGGSVMTRYYTKRGLKMILKGKMDPMVSLQSAPKKAFHPAQSVEVEGEEKAGVPETPVAPVQEPALSDTQTKHMYRLPDATSRKAIEYYRNAATRGYLSHTVEEGKGPSLYFRTPEEQAARLRAFANKAGRSGAKRKAANMMW